MPNFCVSATDDRLPSLTRRRLLTGAAATVASGVATPAQTSGAALDPNVAALVQRFTGALAAYTAAEHHRNICEQRFWDECPVPPLELTSAGPLGWLKPIWDHWSVHDLGVLLSAGGSCKHTRAARKLLPVARSYERKVGRFERAVGLPAAEAAQQAASDALLEASEAILAAPANSPAALALKARVVQWGKPEWWDPVEGRADSYERLAAQILDVVLSTAESGAS